MVAVSVVPSVTCIAKERWNILLTSRVSSGSQIEKSWYKAHSTHCIRFLRFCCASLEEKVRAVIPGQSSCKSRSKSRRFVRNKAIFEGPGMVGGCCCEDGGGFSVFEAGSLRLLPLDNEAFTLIVSIKLGFQSLKRHFR